MVGGFALSSFTWIAAALPNSTIIEWFQRIGPGLAGIGIGIINSLVDYASTKSWFPTDHGVPLPGVKELIAFLLIVGAMFIRGATLPARGELVERRLPEVPRPGRVALPALAISLVCAIALIVLPYLFSEMRKVKHG